MANLSSECVLMGGGIVFNGLNRMGGITSAGPHSQLSSGVVWRHNGRFHHVRKGDYFERSERNSGQHSLWRLFVVAVREGHTSKGVSCESGVAWVETTRPQTLVTDTARRTTEYVTSRNILINSLKIFDFYICLVYNRSMVGIRSLAQDSAC